ncbi:molybdopterin-dependent oxidoreductase [Nocardiopsis ansamitocini]|uniref:Molybdopterin-binding protein n=1 Tax=Nocardiopsis ansamitocini TaxID=1670832 RepID=A0A9W6P7K1_9ACTN|nr:molybdopterin-dependent oxidoreductase [Nocardiopsis ansamitocini]GLU48507.1 molybdopterin-binding protein [Nocardiopsis ansamitocini]
MSTKRDTQSTPEGVGTPKRVLLGALLGVAVTGAALGVAELVAALVGQNSAIVVVGDAAVDYSPAPVKEFAIATFGVYDKIVLIVGIFAVLALFAVALGFLALRRPIVGYLGVAAFAVLGALAGLVGRNPQLLTVLPVVVGALAAMVVLGLLLRLAPLPRSQGMEAGAGKGTEPVIPDGQATADQSSPAPPLPDAKRSPTRRFTLASAGVLVGAAGTGFVGQLMARSSAVGSDRAALKLPAPASPLPPLPAGVDMKVPGLAPFSTPNRDFYRIDTALTVPSVAPDTWTLRIHGMVDRPIEIDFDTLLRRTVVESDITLTCVSNTVGGDLVGNSRWLGVSLRDLLAEAGVQSGADQIFSTSQDGWTCGTPTETVMDGRDALLAFAMDGEPLPLEHGFPVRMVVPGLYGFVSATKWVTDIKLTRFGDDEAYWAQRGWAVKAPIKTMSRIDVPGSLERLPAGNVAVAGVAWAQHTGIEAVEVRADEGEWSEAELAEVPGIDTWRQWIWEWEAEPGRHTLQVRATDASGYTQTSERADPIPNGASGWHSVQVMVE